MNAHEALGRIAAIVTDPIDRPARRLDRIVAVLYKAIPNTMARAAGKAGESDGNPPPAPPVSQGGL